MKKKQTILNLIKNLNIVIKCINNFVLEKSLKSSNHFLSSLKVFLIKQIERNKI